MIDTIMLFAAGLGNRMRHLTENNPKSLISILNKPILYHALELCATYPFKRIVINTHYLSEQIIQAIKDFQAQNPQLPEIITIYEAELLETGGAIKNAYQYFGQEAIFTLNTDIVLKPTKNIFNHLIDHWQPATMDFLLLMQPYAKSTGYTGLGDFDLDLHGNLIRPDKKEHYDYMYSGLQILKPAKIVKHPLRIFSLREYYLNSDKVKGVASPSSTRWYHASNPENIVDIEMDMLAHEERTPT